MNDSYTQQAAIFYLYMLPVLAHPYDFKIVTPPVSIADASISMTNGWVKSGNQRTRAKVNLLHNRSNAAY